MRISERTAIKGLIKDDGGEKMGTGRQLSKLRVYGKLYEIY